MVDEEVYSILLKIDGANREGRPIDEYNKRLLQIVEGRLGDISDFRQRVETLREAGGEENDGRIRLVDMKGAELSGLNLSGLQLVLPADYFCAYVYHQFFDPAHKAGRKFYSIADIRATEVYGSAISETREDIREFLLKLPEDERDTLGERISKSLILFDFSHANMDEVSMPTSTIHACEFRASKIRKFDISDSVISRCGFSEALAQHSKFRNSVLYDFAFFSSHLQHSDFSLSTLLHGYLGDAQLKGIKGLDTAHIASVRVSLRSMAHILPALVKDANALDFSDAKTALERRGFEFANSFAVVCDILLEELENAALQESPQYELPVEIRDEARKHGSALSESRAFSLALDNALTGIEKKLKPRNREPTMEEMKNLRLMQNIAMRYMEKNRPFTQKMLQTRASMARRSVGKTPVPIQQTP